MDADPVDRLPAPLRHGVEQTVAAERLEGWRPTVADLDALVALACDELDFADYLACHRARYPVLDRPVPRVRRVRRVFGRARPYLIPGTNLLRNNFGADSQAMLQDLEFVATAGRIAQWHRHLLAGVGLDDIDVRSLHHHVFADVYPWAGNYRVTELRRGEVVFAWQSSVDQEMAGIEAAARRLAASDVDNGELSYEFARLYADYNQIHPFREGNGRTGTLLLHTVAALCGRQIDLADVSRDEWCAASRDSMLLRRDGRASHRPFLSLFSRALS
jgi:cell filamentation protein